MARCCACVLISLLAMAGVAIADEPAASAPKDRPGQAKLEYFLQRLKSLRLFDPAKPQQPFRLTEAPLLQFDNPVSSILDGYLFIWTDRGRPVSAIKSYYNLPNKSWGRTFVSLAESPIVLESDGVKLWTPQQGGIAFSPLPGAPRPAEQPRLRLVQMRELAEQFTVIDNWGLKDPTDWRLRLLSTPLVRYQVADEDVVDGAMFGYVLSTSPEALLLLEARRKDDRLTWQYAVSRFTRFGITISVGDKKLAEFPRLDAWPATGAYFHSPVSMTEYPFTGDETTKPAKN